MALVAIVLMKGPVELRKYFGVIDNSHVAAFNHGLIMERSGIPFSFLFSLVMIVVFVFVVSCGVQDDGEKETGGVLENSPIQTTQSPVKATGGEKGNPSENVSKGTKKSDELKWLEGLPEKGTLDYYKEIERRIEKEGIIIDVVAEVVTYDKGFRDVFTGDLENGMSYGALIIKVLSPERFKNRGIAVVFNSGSQEEDKGKLLAKKGQKIAFKIRDRLLQIQEKREIDFDIHYSDIREVHKIVEE